jgi:hypothetical protein
MFMDPPEIAPPKEPINALISHFGKNISEEQHWATTQAIIMALEKSASDNKEKIQGYFRKNTFRSPEKLPLQASIDLDSYLLLLERTLSNAYVGDGFEVSSRFYQEHNNAFKAALKAYGSFIKDHPHFATEAVAFAETLGPSRIEHHLVLKVISENCSKDLKKEIDRRQTKKLDIAFEDFKDRLSIEKLMTVWYIAGIFSRSFAENHMDELKQIAANKDLFAEGKRIIRKIHNSLASDDPERADPELLTILYKDCPENRMAEAINDNTKRLESFLENFMRDLEGENSYSKYTAKHLASTLVTFPVSLSEKHIATLMQAAAKDNINEESKNGIALIARLIKKWRPDLVDSDILKLADPKAGNHGKKDPPATKKTWS